MALISKIREKTGLLIGIVAFALILFLVGGDILGPNSVIMGKRTNDVGEIAGQTVDLDEYQKQVEEMKYNFSLNTGRNPTEAEMNSLRQQAWEMMIVRIAFQEQFDKLGLQVTEDELLDMVQGRNITPELAQAFADPATGEVDRNAIVNYLKNLSQMPPQQQQAWFSFEKNLEPSRLRIKYDNLLGLTSYVTKAEAEQEHQAQNEVAEIRYLYVPYYTISDTAVEVSDTELQNYLEENQKKYQVEESRSLQYVSFSVRPTPADSAVVREELERVKNEFKTVEDDSSFARRNSDGGAYFTTYPVAQLPQPLMANAQHLNEGEVKGPYWHNNNYVLYKVSDVVEDTVYSARASHILIKPAGKENPRKQAEDILKELQKGADFAELAKKHSEDGSASKGGDLGWFAQGRMVKPFEDAVFSTSKAGLINRLVETEYGFHIIKVTEPKTNLAYKVAAIEREMIASEETRDEAYRKADAFTANISNLTEFTEAAKNEGLTVMSGERIGKNDRRINNLAEAREVVRWLYNEASEGDVSKVFEVENDYVVAVMTDAFDAGTAPLSQVRDEITVKIRNDKKGAQITSKLQDLNGSLDEIAKAYGADAKVYTSSDLKINTNSLPGAGFAPLAVGKAFALENGQRSIPIKEDGGVVVVELVAKTPAPEVADFSNYKQQLQQKVKSRSSYSLSEAVKEHADIKDERYKFF